MVLQNIICWSRIMKKDFGVQTCLCKLIISIAEAIIPYLVYMTSLHSCRMLKGDTPLSHPAHSPEVLYGLWSSSCKHVEGFWGIPHCEVNNSPCSCGWYNLISNTSWSWATQWAIWQTFVRNWTYCWIPYEWHYWLEKPICTTGAGQRNGAAADVGGSIHTMDSDVTA